MLNQEILKDGTAIEKIFCEPFEKLQRHQMSEDLTKLMIKLMMSDKNVTIPEKDKPFLFKVIESRIKHCFTYSIDDNRLILFLMMLTQSPGTAVMYLTYLQYWVKKYLATRNITNIDFETFCMEIFPMGFPCEEDLSQLWRNCKVAAKPDNLLDHSSAGASIHICSPTENIS